MKIVLAFLIALCAPAFGEDAPTTMTKLMVKLERADIPKDSFADEPKRMYRAGSRYCRTEENPDLENGIHGLLILNEPDYWMINRLTKSGRHYVDEGPTCNCRMPIFSGAVEIKTAQDMKNPFLEIEFGHELEYFRPRSNAPVPGPVLLGKETKNYVVEVGDSKVVLFTDGDPEAPVAIARSTDKGRQEIYWYGEFELVPFDAKLFAPPEGIKIEEAKP